MTGFDAYLAMLDRSVETVIASLPASIVEVDMANACQRVDDAYAADDLVVTGGALRAGLYGLYLLANEVEASHVHRRVKGGMRELVTPVAVDLYIKLRMLDGLEKARALLIVPGVDL